MPMDARPSAGDTPWVSVGGQIYDSCQGPLANLQQSATQGILNNTDTALTWDQENIDTHNGHDNVTNNSRWTCPTGWDGYYLVAGTVFYASGASGVRVVWLRKNTATEIAGSVNRRGPFSGNDGDGIPTPSCVVFLAAGDYVALRTIHTQGSTVNTLNSGQYVSGMNVAFLRF